MSSGAPNTHLKYFRKTKAQLVEELEKLERQVADGDRAGRFSALKPAMPESEDLFQLILDVVPVGISYFDRQRKICLANERYLHFLGLPRTKLIGKTLRQVLGEKAYKTAGKYAKRVLAGETVTFDNTLPGKDGGEISVKVSYVPRFGPDKSVEGFFALVQDITEIKQSQEQCRTAIESMPGGFLYFDADDRLAVANSKIAEIYPLAADVFVPGVSYETCLRTTVERGQWGPINGQDKEEWIQERLARHYDPEGTLEFNTSDGRCIRVEEKRTPDGGIVGVRTDITELKRIERELREAHDELEARVEERTKEMRESEERFRFAFENAPVGMSLISPEGRRFKVNKALADFLGYTLDELANTDMKSTAADFDDLDESMRLRQQVLDGEIETYRNERRYRHKNGHVVWGEVSGSLFRNEDGDPEHFIVHTIDITERKKAEEARERLSQAIENVPVGIALFDSDDRLVFFNNRYGEMMKVMADILRPGVSFEDMIRTMVDRQPVKDAQGREEEFIRERVEHHRNPTGPYDIRRQDKWLRADEARLPDGSIFNIISDVTEQKQAEEDRRLALIDAEQANQAKSEFLASMSHELRTPLNAILGFSDILIHQYFGPPGAGKYREYAEDIHASGEHLLELVNEILDLSTIEAGKQSLVKEKLSTDEIVRECVKSIAEKARSQGIELVTEVPENLPTLYADRRAIKQILLNLLSNSVKFTAKGGKITVSAKASSRVTTLKVDDTGRGIPAEKLPKLTDPFNRGEQDPHKFIDGWGLGLSITNSLIDLHDGTMGIKSTVGKGTMVTVKLPNGAP